MPRKFKVTKDLLQKVNSKLNEMDYSPNSDKVFNDYEFIKENFSEIRDALNHDEIPMEDINEQFADLFADYAAYYRFHDKEMANDYFSEKLDELHNEIKIDKKEFQAAFNYIFARKGDNKFDDYEYSKDTIKEYTLGKIEFFNGVTKEMQDEFDKVDLDKSDEPFDFGHDDDINLKEEKGTSKDEKKVVNVDVTIEECDRERMEVYLQKEAQFRRDLNGKDPAERLNELVENAANSKEIKEAQFAAYPSLKQKWDNTHWYDFFKNPIKFINTYRDYKNTENTLKNEYGYSQKTLDSFNDISNKKYSLRDVDFKLSNKTIDSDDPTPIEDRLNELEKNKHFADLAFQRYKNLKNRDLEEQEENERVFSNDDSTFKENPNVEKAQFVNNPNKEQTVNKENKID